MWLPWRPALVFAALSAVVAMASRRSNRRAVAFLAVFCQELALVLVLYALWQFLASLGTVREADGFANGKTVYDVERTLHIGTEGTIEGWFLPHPLWVQACNAYYAIVHGPALIAFLVWLFVRHRERYPRIRNTVALVTGICLAIHLAPVAPPRLYPELGFVDAAKVYGQSVYGTIGQGLSDQMSAMPSVHMAWALIVAVGVITVSSSRWRWWILVHVVATAVAIVATANHWWADGIVAGMILGLVMASQQATAWGLDRWRLRRAGAPALVPAGAD